MPTKLLLIEDENTLRENIAELLCIKGYQVASAVDGRQGLSQALLAPPDLIICDILMPNLNGYELLEIVRKTPALVRIPFIFLTAKSETTDIRQGMNQGADDYLTKPTAITDLIKAIESRLLHRKQWMITAPGVTENHPANYLATIGVYTDKGNTTLRTEDCLYFFTKERRYYVVHQKDTYQLNKSLDKLSEQLDPVQFFRVNRKEIIHRKTLRHYTYWGDGKYCLFLQHDTKTQEVILPRARYREFLSWLQ